MSASPATKARYFFSIRYRDRLLPDREGVELADDADLAACARFLANRLRDDEVLSSDMLAGCAVEVTDARGSLLQTVFVSGH